MSNTYCLGYEHKKCNTCSHENTWQELNQMPDTLRLAMQSNMKRINIDACRLSNMGAWQERTKQ